MDLPRPLVGPGLRAGSFMEHLLPKYGASSFFKQLSWKKFQNPYPLEGAFTLHFQQQFRINCLLYLNDLSEMFGLSNRAVETLQAGRNDPCPCGSGKRYKHCHGRLAGAGSQA